MVAESWMAWAPADAHHASAGAKGIPRCSMATLG
jgi:hypothetical protein